MIKLQFRFFLLRLSASLNLTSIHLNKFTFKRIINIFFSIPSSNSNFIHENKYDYINNFNKKYLKYLIILIKCESLFLFLNLLRLILKFNNKNIN